MKANTTRTQTPAQNREISEALTSSHSLNFEDLVTRLYRRLGYTVIATSPERELGPEFIAIRNQSTVAVHAKWTMRKIGVDAIREANLARLLFQADAVHLVVNADFTPGALRLAQELKIQVFPGRDLIRLFDENELAELLGLEASMLDIAKSSNSRRTACDRKSKN